MSRGLVARVATVGLVALAGWLVPGVAAAQDPKDGPDVVDSQRPVDTPVRFPVQTWKGTVQDIHFPTASVDGAVVDGGDNTFELASDVLFEFDESALTPRAQTELATIAGKITAAGAAGRAITVVGYTDDVGGDDYNQRLSTERAESVKTALAATLGPQAAITATGRGEAEPVDTNDTDAGRAHNRRVEIAVAP